MSAELNDEYEAKTTDLKASLRCAECNSPRTGTKCRKCGGPLTEPCEGWEDPELPDVEPIRAAAFELGYAVGEHGTKERDLDVMVVPWDEKARQYGPRAVIEHVAERIGGRVIEVETKPLGRVAATIQKNGWYRPIDISVMAPHTHLPTPLAQKLNMTSPFTFPNKPAYPTGSPKFDDSEMLNDKSKQEGETFKDKEKK